MDNVLQVDNVHRRFGEVEAVAGMSFEVRLGEIVGVVGPNGAGKTTLFSIIAGLVSPDSGTVAICGADIRDDRELSHSLLGYGPQELGLYPALSARHNLIFFAEMQGVNRSYAKVRAEELISRFDMGDFADRRIAVLSGGERRRVHVACALVADPKLILLDEPTVGMDVDGRLRFLDQVRDLGGGDRGVCFSSHYLTEVEELCDRVVIVDHGRVVAAGSIPDLLTRHASSYVEFTLSDKGMLVTEVNDPESALPKLIRELGEDIATLSSVRVIRPSLEAVFLAVTGRSYDEGITLTP